MEHYVTLFDRAFLPQGLALHMSMQRHLSAFTLWILCLDDETYAALERLQLANVRLMPLAKLETRELLAVKPVRSRGEYCWTLTPFAPAFVFAADATVQRVTYVDADLWFMDDPAEIFEELDRSGKSVLITEHAYSPEFDHSPAFGKFCVQFVTFARAQGEKVRKDWESKCIDWCYARVEDGRFGDQKYLDEWPRKYRDDVHVLKNKELLQAPWNAGRFALGSAVVWHFHGLRLARVPLVGFLAGFGSYPLPRVVRRHVYGPYRADLFAAIERLRSIGLEVRNQVRPGLGFVLRLFSEPLYRLMTRTAYFNGGRIGP